MSEVSTFALAMEGSHGVWPTELVEEIQLAGGSRGWLVALPTGLRHHQTGETRNSWVIAPQYTEMPLVDAWKGSVIPVRVCSLTEGADVHALGEGDLAIDYLGDIAQDEAVLPPEFDVAQFWVETKSRIERFISQHGHSRVPRDYHDEDGRLGGLVGNIRWFVAGRGGIEPGALPRNRSCNRAR